jgi:acetolactate synthase I/II/III large subunit
MAELPESATAIGVLVKCLEAERVEYIFGVPGGAIIPLHEVLFADHRIRYILAKHEEGAAFMADGYARVRRGLGVCSTTTGPGATNALTGIAAAYADSVPVLLLTGQVPTRAFGRGSLQDSTAFGVDLVSIFRPVTKLSTMLPHAERMPEFVQRALRTALSGRRGPVHLNLPSEMLKQSIPWIQKQPAQYRTNAAPVDLAAVAEAARLLVESECPCLLIGHGANLAGAWGELLSLAERLRIPVATTPKGKSVFPESHPLSLGVFGFAGHPRAEEYLLSDRVDVLVVVGSSLGELSTNAWESRLRPTKAFIHIDIDPCELGKNYAIDVGIVGDARAVLQKLNAEIESLLEGQARSGDPLTDVRGQVPRYIEVQPASRSAAPMKPQHLVEEMRAVLPDDAILFIDSGNCVSWSVHYYESRLPHTYFLSMGLAAMGHATAAAIGGKLAAPERQVVALVGDAAFAMNGMEVHTAVEYKIPVIWVVLNNQGHGMVYHGEKLMLGYHLNACQFRVPLDVAALATAMGARAFRADTLDTFRAALEASVATDGPCVIDAQIDPEEVPQSLIRRARTVAASVDNSALSMRPPLLRSR